MDTLYDKLKSGVLTPEQVLGMLKGPQIKQEDSTCYYEESLKAQPLKQQSPISTIKLMLISDDNDSINMLLNSDICTKGEVTTVVLSNSYSRISSNKYQIRKDSSDDYKKLYQELEAHNALPEYIMCYSHNNQKNNTVKGLETAVRLAFAVTQIIKYFSRNTNLKYIHAYKEDKEISYSNYAISGMLKTISQEYPNIMHKNICFRKISENLISQKLSEELSFDGALETDIYYLEDKRYINILKEIQRHGTNQSNYANTFKHGVFVITGGTGELGLSLANYLISHGSRRIYLLGRKQPSEKITTRLHSIDSTDTIIKYLCCDVEDKIACEQTVANILEQDGQITGLFHCAGVIYDSLLTNIEIENFNKCVNPKIKGLINLLDSFAKYTCVVKFVKLYSSITSMLGNIGQVTYSFANGLLNAFAIDDNSPYSIFNIQSICWPYWEDGGQKVDNNKLTKLMKLSGQKPLNTKEGMSALEKVSEADCKNPLILFGEQSKIREYVAQSRKNKIKSDETSNIIRNRVIAKEQLIDYIQGIISQIIKMPKEKLNIKTTWENYGIDSLSIMRFNEVIEEIMPDLPKTLMYEYRNILSLSEYFYEKHLDKFEKVLLKDSSSQELETAKAEVRDTYVKPSTSFIQNSRFKVKKEEPEVINKTHNHNNPSTSEKKDIAIVGIAGKYPMANNLDDFWENLLDGKDCIEEIPIERWDYKEDYHPDKMKHGYVNSKWGGFLNDFDCFDAEFFNMTPREARYIDPQERIFLECAWHGIEDAGYTKEMLNKQRVGVFAGIMYSHYQLYGLDYNQKGKKRAFNSSYASIPNRVSYYMNFHGPSMAIDTMCSSSLTAIHLACESIRNGSCTMAIAGGVNLSLHPNKYINLSQNNFLSSEGKCRSFGEGGDGYVPSEGVGTVILKTLEAAERDNDYIYGVLKATSINHGGTSNGFTVPNPVAQTEAIQDAIGQAKVNPNNIGYIETHGTGTPLGDPIELSALSKAFGTTEKCPVGSVKSNIGHAESAAGIAGLVKILLQMKHNVLVPSIHCKKLNKNINFAELPFYVQDKVQSWEHKKVDSKEIPYIAGLSSFGAGGANAHLIIEEYVANTRKQVENKGFKYNIILISAKSKQDLIKYSKTYVEYLKKCEDSNASLEHISYATQFYRNMLKERLAIIGSSYQDVIQKLKSFISSSKTEEGVIYVSEEEREYKQDSILKGQYYFNGETEKPEFINLATEGLFTDNFDWNVLWEDIEYPKLNLPLYPFERTRYWLTEDYNEHKNKTENTSLTVVKERVQERVINKSTLHGIKYESKFYDSDFFVRDHIVKGFLVLPGAALVLNARKVGTLASNGQLRSIDNMTFVSPVQFDNKEVELITKINNKTLEIKTQLMRDTKATTVSIGNLNVSESIQLTGKIDITGIKRRCQERIYSEPLYKALKSHGLNYGESLSIIDFISYSDEESLVELQTSNRHYEDCFENKPSGSLVSCIDAAFQSVYVFGKQFDLTGNKVMLPYKLGRIVFSEKNFTPKYIYVKCNKTKEETDFSIVVCDDNGIIYMRIERLCLMQIAEKETANKLVDNNEISQIIQLLEQDHISLEEASAILEEKLYVIR